MKPDRDNERALLNRGPIIVQFIWHQSLNGVAFKLTQDLLPYKLRRQDSETITFQIKTNEKIKYFLENSGKLFCSAKNIEANNKEPHLYIGQETHTHTGFLTECFPDGSRGGGRVFLLKAKSLNVEWRKYLCNSK